MLMNMMSQTLGALNQSDFIRLSLETFHPFDPASIFVRVRVHVRLGFRHQPGNLRPQVGRWAVVQGDLTALPRCRVLPGSLLQVQHQATLALAVREHMVTLLRQIRDLEKFNEVSVMDFQLAKYYRQLMF